MFESTEEKITKLVKKGKWEKIKAKYLYSNNVDELALLAKACSQSDSDDSVNVLVALLDVADQKVVLEALHSLGQVGTDHAVANLQLMFQETDPANKERKDAIQDALNKIRDRK